LDNEHYLALMIDGVVMADHTIVVALGIDENGKKRILGLWEGATENAAVCQSLLMDLVDQGLCTGPGILVTLMGAKPFVPPYGMYSEKQPLFSDAKCIS
jgi:putative transposase